MYYDETGCHDIQICYIGGGSQGWAWKLMSDLYLEDSLSGTVRLYDIDIEAARTNEKIGKRMFSYKDAKGKWDFVTSNTLEEGLRGADFVIISILPATFEEMRSDVHAPEKYGIWQSVGDTVGPGGIFRALRTIPMYEVIGNGIKKCCPDAWVINYTNPMALCTGALYKVFPDIKAFGCCHEVFGIQRVLQMALEEVVGIKEKDRHKLCINVVGINHFTWVTQATYKGLDLFPIYDRFVENHYKEGICDKITDPHFMSKNRVKFDLFKKYGVMAAAGDRHLAEFVPEYVKDPKTVESWGFSLTPVDYRIENKSELNQKSIAYASGEKEIPIEPSGEEGVAQIKALLGLGDLVTNVNLPNVGQMEAETGAIVETNAYFTKNSVRPVFSGGLPDGVKIMMDRHLETQQMILKAALDRNLNLAFEAFYNDPMLGRLGREQAKELFNTMVMNIKEYLPGYEIR